MTELSDKILQYDTTFHPKNLEVFDEIFTNGTIASGKYQKLLQNRLKKLTSCKHVFLTSSGTAALHIALLSLGISVKHDVILPSYLCQEVLNSVRYVNANPQFVDINSSNYSADFENIKKSVSKKTGAIIIPYMYGDTFTIEELLETGVPIIEDLAHCTGGEINGKKLGSYGTVAMTSFGDRKFLDGGYGGAVFTNDDELADKISSFLSISTKKYKLNFNYHIPNIISAIIYEKSFLLEQNIKNRKKIARRFLEELSKTVSIRYNDVDDSFFHRFILDLKGNKNQFITSMYSKGIICGVGVAEPLHTIFKNKKHLPNTELASKNSVALPIRPNLSDSEVDLIIKSVKSSVL